MLSDCGPDNFGIFTKKQLDVTFPLIFSLQKWQKATRQIISSFKITWAYSGVARGGTGGTPLGTEKNCCRKMMLFPKALFLATTFTKIVKNSIFLLNFNQKLSKISQNFPTMFFVQTPKNERIGLLIFLKNMLK